MKLNYIKDFKDEIEKIALNALEKRQLSKSLNLIFEGSGRDWALRNLRHGKTFEELGSVSLKHLKSAAPLIKKVSPEGREVGFDVYKTKRTPITVGGVGFVNSKIAPSTKMTKTFHTHPYKGMESYGSAKDMFKALFKSVGESMGQKTSKEEFEDMYNVVKSSSKFKKLEENFNKIKAKKLFTPTEAAHPDPENLSAIKGLQGDLVYFNAIPKASHNILNPDEMVLGVHKIRPKGLRTYYRQMSKQASFNFQKISEDFSKWKNYSAMHRAIAEDPKKYHEFRNKGVLAGTLAPVLGTLGYSAYKAHDARENAWKRIPGFSEMPVEERNKIEKQVLGKIKNKALVGGLSLALTGALLGRKLMENKYLKEHGIKGHILNRYKLTPEAKQKYL